MKKIDLNGAWEYFCPRSNKWLPINLPSNWEKGGLTNYAGRVKFRKSFIISTLCPEKNYWLKFNGVDYKAKVFLNNKLLGTHEGYFQPFAFNISKKIHKEINNLLVEVDSCPEKTKDWPENKRYIKGVYGHHDIRPGGWHPKYRYDHSTGGIWNTVELFETDAERIKNIWVTPILNKNYSKAKVIIKIKLEKNGKTTITTKQIIINKPKLWWTHDHGKPYIYKLTIRAGNTEETVAFGIREVKFDKNHNLFLNGRKIFVRGSNIIPEEYLSQYTEERIRQDIKLAKNANLNALRIHAHVTRKEFYDECDRQGILIWQDFPLQWEYANTPKFTKEAVRQIGDMVNFLYNHPSIFFWCCHNEPIKSRTKLDPILFKTVTKMDNSRAVIMNSDFKEHPYPGWFVGNMEHFVSLPGKPFITEFGAQALPDKSTLKKIFPEKDIWPPNWQKWSYHNFVYEQTLLIAGIKKGNSIEEFIVNSQDYQSKLIKFAIERYRSQKFIQVSGIFHFLLTDPWPCISYSVLDYYRVPKKGYFALKDAFQPLLMIYFPERASFTIGDSIRGMFYLINDYPYGFKNATMHISIGRHKFPTRKINIRPNSRIVANNIVYPLPLSKKFKEGKYNFKIQIKSSQGKVISENNYSIYLERIPKGLLEYNAIFDWSKYQF
jgi:beta-mannosidase